MEKRGSGILLHLTSLPSNYGIGDLGSWAYKFVDFLSQTKQSFWQILPLNPTDTAQGNSPYSSISAFATNPLMISPKLMMEHGFLSKTDIEPPPRFPKEQVDYQSVTAYKKKVLELAYQRFKRKSNHEYAKFCLENSYWLEDFALFISLKSHFRESTWNQWPQSVKNREEEALKNARKEFCDKIEKVKFLQFLFWKQWSSLKRYCSEKGIQIIGDIPIYVSFDSTDTWSNPQIFKLDQEKRPSFVSGVPPDYFSQTGQLWGNPVYKWEELKKTGYTWWIQRIRYNLSLFDLVRIDHFRGLVAYWEIPAGDRTAANGRWVEVPVEDFFQTLFRHFPNLPIIAEDLGLITPEVKEIIHRFGFPGMKVLLFAFGENNPMHPYLPHVYDKQCVVYTGTHDNNTIKGWFEKEANPEDKKRLFRYLGREIPVHDIHWELIRLAMSSVANLVIFPYQDILGLGEEARMNRPATANGNWQWRILPEQLTPSIAEKLLEMVETYGRA